MPQIMGWLSYDGNNGNAAPALPELCPWAISGAASLGMGAAGTLVTGDPGGGGKTGAFAAMGGDIYRTSSEPFPTNAEKRIAALY